MSRSDLAVATVGPRAGQNQIADDALFQLVPGRAERIGRNRPVGRRIGNHLGQHLFLQRRDRVGPGLLALGLLGRLERLVIAST